jgi:hypothetical protein
MKLIGFVKEIILYQNIKILNKKFFSKAYLTMLGEKKSVFFTLIYSKMSEYELVKKLGSYDNFKGLKSMVKVPQHKLFARNKLSAPTVFAHHPSVQCCGSESGSESERIRAFLAESESEIFVPDSDSYPDSDPVPDPVI